MNDFDRQWSGESRRSQPDHNLSSFLEAFLEDQADPTDGDVNDPGGGAKHLARRTDVANRFQAARVTDAGAPLGPGAFGALLCRLGSSGLNRSISWY